MTLFYSSVRALTRNISIDDITPVARSVRAIAAICPVRHTCSSRLC